MSIISELTVLFVSGCIVFSTANVLVGYSKLTRARDAACKALMDLETEAMRREHERLAIYLDFGQQALTTLGRR